MQADREAGVGGGGGQFAVGRCSRQREQVRRCGGSGKARPRASFEGPRGGRVAVKVTEGLFAKGFGIKYLLFL